jgi:gamma-glutamyltranspeptidase/glutathione hydrolase
MTRGAVASGHPGTSAAASEALRAGGNAFDAACAGGFASAIAEPALTSLGGGGFLLARTAGGESVLFDFFVDTPGRGRDLAALEPHFFPITVHFGASDQDFNVGRGSIAVPGVLAGLLRVHERLGSLPLEQVVRPAVRLARDGVELSDKQAYFLEILNPIFALEADSRAIYTRDGRPYAAGDRLHNPDFADFLERLPRTGGRSFYAGDLAARIVRDMGEDGLLTESDLAAYRVIERQPLEIGYRDATILTNPPPSFGGSLLALSLALLQSEPLAELRWGSPAYLARLIEVEQRVEALRAQGVRSPESLRTFSRGTTQLSVADAAGNVASMTTSNGEGSGYVVPGTGITLNNMLGEDDLHPEGFHASPPAQRVASMMSPSLLLQEGRLGLVLGSGGSKRIRSAILQVLTQRLDFGRSLEEAVRAPRVHWDGETVQVEPGYSPETIDALRARWPVNVWPELNVYFGGVHAVEPGLAGAGDPRRGGSVAVLGASGAPEGRSGADGA